MPEAHRIDRISRWENIVFAYQQYLTELDDEQFATELNRVRNNGIANPT
ncbi:hypothetical protein MSTE_00981 [Mycobacteroides stephanolepidis]|uniref:Uncharacterized protein n=1 Tax=[Mycobacterium] stephanolepidis TaxID=1520670 RepID=A0A1Z4ETM3_9MYCO|nr:hypothetical protein [[Mycobacterium] stephanolepidis]BAX96316.1 hypothetical protein MSTE_00981 [[Mycobacterium] stephanolepidis]